MPETLTPAERLALSRPRKRAPRNQKTVRRKVWDCRIRAERERLGLTLDAVAAAVKLSKTALWQVEQGTDPQLTTARRLATFFGKTTDELWPLPAMRRRAALPREKRPAGEG